MNDTPVIWIMYDQEFMSLYLFWYFIYMKKSWKHSQMNNEEIVCLKEMVNLKLILLDALGIAQ